MEDGPRFCGGLAGCGSALILLVYSKMHILAELESCRVAMYRQCTKVGLEFSGHARWNVLLFMSTFLLRR